ncbi:MAG: A/G-specific adenine glycosylase [Rhodobacteraceae bacterium]|nr:A/G-specific adenine glycosylase [Paracoccaceae bacterium]MCY4249372.1 A/G-specific adenine glycosylase [Paracoccaceae bacterium]
MTNRPSDKLLAWYDHNGRTLPWRMKKGSDCTSKPDPYRIWISEIMLQQTTVPVVTKYYEKFLDLWPTVEDLANAIHDEVMACWAGLGYYTRARNLIPCAKRIVMDHDGKFPSTSGELLDLPGIGTYTASAIQAIAFDLSVPVVDGNAERVYSRVTGLTTPLPRSKPEIKRIAEQMTPLGRSGDYAQAIMDLGSIVCKPKMPNCPHCPWNGFCQSYRLGLQNEIPYRQPKTPKPTRSGIMYVCLSENNHFMLERRPQSGLLGGTLGWPGFGWDKGSGGKFPELTGGLELPGEISHVFTHFKTSIAVRAGVVESSEFSSLDVAWVDQEGFDASKLPTLMRKVFTHAAKNFDFEKQEKSMKITRY